MNNTLETTTSIAKGQVAYKGRRYVGQYYVSMGMGTIAHSTTLCPNKKQSAGYRRIPVYEENGDYWWQANKATAEAEQVRGRTTLCESCPELDSSWMDKAACFGVMDTGFGDGDVRVIEEYCNHCPVVLECFEYGVTLARDNAGTVWGGIVIPKSETGRKAAIIRRRKELSIEEGET